MNAKLIFFITSSTIFILSIISICCAPIINKLFPGFENWKSLNCALYSDLEDSKEIQVNNLYNFRYLKNLCRRQKATYNLEYTSLIFNTSLSFIFFYLSLLLHLSIGKEYKNTIGIFGFISGIICFILTLTYVCFSGYMFNNDIAFGRAELNHLSLTSAIRKLFPNGATYKWSKDKYISAYEEDSSDYSSYIRYKDLGDRRYNYDNDLVKKFNLVDQCHSSSRPPSYIYSCEYIFDEPSISISNKYLYDRWMTTLVLNCFIFVFNICHSIFGLLLFKDKTVESEPIKTNSPNVIQLNTNVGANDLIILNGNKSDKIKEIKGKEITENENEKDSSRNEIKIKKDDLNKISGSINDNNKNINKIKTKPKKGGDEDDINKDIVFKDINIKENKDKEYKNEELTTNKNNDNKEKENKNKETDKKETDAKKIENNDLIDLEDNNEENNENVNDNIIKENQNDKNEIIIDNLNNNQNNNKGLNLIDTNNDNKDIIIDTNNNNIKITNTEKTDKNVNDLNHNDINNLIDENDIQENANTEDANKEKGKTEVDNHMTDNERNMDNNNIIVNDINDNEIINNIPINNNEINNNGNNENNNNALISDAIINNNIID